MSDTRQAGREQSKLDVVVIPRALRPTLTAEHRSRLLRLGRERYLAADYYGAHEPWEAVWRSTTPEPKPLIQGLILLTVSLHHAADRGRPDVALRVLAKARQRIELYTPQALGLDLGLLLRDMKAWEQRLESEEKAQPPAPRLLVLDPRAWR